jgi:hypothetical protein
MDQIVAVEVTLADGQRRFILTWGRLHSTVDPGPLERLVLAKCTKFGLGERVSARVCRTMQEACDQPYFLEGLSALTVVRAAALMSGDDAFWDQVRTEMDEGRHLYYLGEPVPPGRG